MFSTSFLVGRSRGMGLGLIGAACDGFSRPLERKRALINPARRLRQLHRPHAVVPSE
jgi:hypothetical protein